MRKRYLIYFGILSFLFMHQIALSMATSPHENKNAFQKFTAFKDEFIKRINALTEKESPKEILEKIQEEINNTFVDPIAKAINNEDYNLAYYLIKKSRFEKSDLDKFNLSINAKKAAQNLSVNLLNPSPGEPLIKLIVNSKNPLLLIAAESWIAEVLTRNFAAFRDNPSYRTTIGNKITHILDIVKAELGAENLKNIVMYVLNDVNPTKDNTAMFDFVKTEMKKQGIDLSPTSSPQKELFLIEKEKSKATYNFIQYALGKAKGWAKDPDSVAKKVEDGANIDGRDIITEDTVLLLAIKNYPEAAEYIIAAGADVNLWGEWKQTPLMAAALQKNITVVNSLIDRGASLNSKDALGRTALTLIAQNPEKNVISITTSGKNLSDLAKQDALTIIDTLIKHGADATIKDVFGKSALDYAKDDPLILEAIKKGIEKHTPPMSLPEKINTLQIMTNQLNRLSTAKPK